MLQLCEVGEALAPVVSACQAIAEFDGVDFALSVGKSLPAVQGEARVLQEAMSNIMDNALKYSQLGKGDPTVRLIVSKLPLSKLPEGMEAGVQILVEDQGPGVDKKEIPLLCCKTPSSFGSTPLHGSEGCMRRALARLLFVVHALQLDSSSR